MAEGETSSKFKIIEKHHLMYSKRVNKDTGYVEPHCISARHVLAIMGFLGFAIVYALRVNLSVAMVAMVNSTPDNYKNDSNECSDYGGVNSTYYNNKAGEFDWDEPTQGHILGGFFYGYILTQIPGGWLAVRIGGKALFGCGVFCSSALNLITPLAARQSVYLLIAVRIVAGIIEGVMFPAMHAMLGQWAPVFERSRLVAITFAGTQLGTVTSLLISSVLCDGDFMGGWPSGFYVFGTLGCVWFVAWMLLIHNSPAEHPRISREEREHIEHSIGKKEVVHLLVKCNLATPWKSILTSPAVISVCIAHAANNWGLYMLLTFLPTYLHTILKFDIKEVFSCQDPFLIVSGYVGCNDILVMFFLTLSVGFSGFITGGFMANHLDIAPRFAGVLMGLTNATASIPGFLSPFVVGVLTKNNQTKEQWQQIFFINGAVCLLGCIIYNIFAEGEELPWAHITDQTLTKVTGEHNMGSDFKGNVSSVDCGSLPPVYSK